MSITIRIGQHRIADTSIALVTSKWFYDHEAQHWYSDDPDFGDATLVRDDESPDVILERPPIMWGNDDEVYGEIIAAVEAEVFGHADWDEEVRHFRYPNQPPKKAK